MGGVAPSHTGGQLLLMHSSKQPEDHPMRDKDDRRAESVPGACRICGSLEWAPIFDGAIRNGVFGRQVEATVYRCQSCGVDVLPPTRSDTSEFYEGGRY